MKKFICFTLVMTIILLGLTGCLYQTIASGIGKAAYNIESIDKSLVEGNSKFAFDIFKKLNIEDANKNIFISPYSISTALAMAYNGSKGSTQASMAKALGYENIDIKTLNDSYKNLNKYLKHTDRKIELNISNSIWVRDGVEVGKEFLGINKASFFASVNMLNFASQDAADRINKWISSSTKGMIKKMIEPPISPDTILYLINTIYFKGQWANKFDPALTSKQTFNSGSGLKIESDMMSSKADLEYMKGEDYKAVKLPYGNKNTAMYVILPDESTTAVDFIQRLDNEKWLNIKNKMSKIENLMLKIPKFTMEYGVKDLKQSLSSLGMGEAFSRTADFSGISEEAFISKVIHKAVIEVDEEGSKASAATVVEIQMTSFAEPVTFVADRPFIFVIAEEKTGSILFLGKVYEL